MKKIIISIIFVLVLLTINPYTIKHYIRPYLLPNDKASIEELKLDVNKSKPGLEVIVDRKVAGQLGVSTAQVGQTLRRSVYGEKISTYKEDKDYVVKSFARLIEDGVYQKNLFEDLK